MTSFYSPFVSLHGFHCLQMNFPSLKVVRNSFPFSITTELYEMFYSFVVKDYYYLLIADVAITFKLINSCTLTDTLVVMAT